MRAPLVIAHRGDSANRPENTLAAFARALEVGATVIELDVQPTLDGEVVVLHDALLERTTDGAGEVRLRSLTDLRGLSAGYPSRFGSTWADQRIPTLTEALSFLRGRARVLVEIKPESVTDDADDGIEARTVATVRGLEMADSVMIVSFAARPLARVGRLAPEIRRGQLFARTTADEILRAVDDTGCNLVLPHKSQLDAALAARIHDAGLMLGTWLVDTPEELRQAARLGVYGVGSNCPGVLIDALANGLLDE